MYVYIRGDKESLWTAGFYKPDGGRRQRRPRSYLNGGTEEAQETTRKALMLRLADVSRLEGHLRYRPSQWVSAPDCAIFPHTPFAELVNLAAHVDEVVGITARVTLSEAPVLSWGVVLGVVAECHGELERLQSAIEEAGE